MVLQEGGKTILTPQRVAGGQGGEIRPSREQGKVNRVWQREKENLVRMGRASGGRETTPVMMISGCVGD